MGDLRSIGAMSNDDPNRLVVCLLVGYLNVDPGAVGVPRLRTILNDRAARRVYYDNTEPLVMSYFTVFVTHRKFKQVSCHPQNFGFVHPLPRMVFLNREIERLECFIAIFKLCEIDYTLSLLPQTVTIVPTLGGECSEDADKDAGAWWAIWLVKPAA
jgi:hypothetical protein